MMAVNNKIAVRGENAVSISEWKDPRQNLDGAVPYCMKEALDQKTTIWP